MRLPGSEICSQDAHILPLSQQISLLLISSSRFTALCLLQFISDAFVGDVVFILDVCGRCSAAEVLPTFFYFGSFVQSCPFDFLKALN